MAARMSPADAEELTAALDAVFNGNDPGQRLIAWCEHMGVPEALGLSARDWYETRLDPTGRGRA